MAPCAFPRSFSHYRVISRKSEARDRRSLSTCWEWIYSLLWRKKKGKDMRHFAVHLSPEQERERESAVSRTSCNRMIQRRTRMSLCAGNRHSMKEQTCASLSFHTFLWSISRSPPSVSEKKRKGWLHGGLNPFL